MVNLKFVVIFITATFILKGHEHKLTANSPFLQLPEKKYSAKPENKIKGLYHLVIKDMAELNRALIIKK
jgi:hypothetical protein